MSPDTEALLIAEQAAEWLIRLETATAEERADFLKWLKESPRHVHEVLLAAASHVQLSEFFGAGRIDVDALLRAADSARDLEPYDTLDNDTDKLNPSPTDVSPPGD